MVYGKPKILFQNFLFPFLIIFLWNNTYLKHLIISFGLGAHDIIKYFKYLSNQHDRLLLERMVPQRTPQRNLVVELAVFLLLLVFFHH